MKFDIVNQWSGKVQFTAEIECDADTNEGLKIGLAVRWGHRNGACLVGASLDGARLDGASLDGARLDGASLDDACLDGALDGDKPLHANSPCLRSFKADFWLTLSGAKAEIPALMQHIREGKINGSVYEG